MSKEELSKTKEDKKIKCFCGCNNTLYIADLTEDSDMVMIGSEENARKKFKNFTGVWVKRKELVEILEQKKD